MNLIKPSNKGTYNTFINISLIFVIWYLSSRYHGVSFRELATGGRPLRRTGCHRDFGRIRHISGDCGRTGPFIKDVPEYRKL